MSYNQFPNIGGFLKGDIVGNISKGIGLKYISNHECNCNSTIKVKGTCAYRGESGACCVIYKVKCKQFISFYVGNTKNNLKKRTGRHLQYVTQKVYHDKTRILLRLISLNILTKN